MKKRNELMTLALSYYGLDEIEKGKFNPKVIEMLKEVTGDDYITNIPWCACFVNYILKKTGHESNNKLNARSLLELGKPTQKPKVGDLVIFWRESVNSWKGHVGFYITGDDSVTYVLSGNQNNRVCVKPYPTSQILGYRELTEVKKTVKKTVTKKKTTKKK